MPFRVGPLCLIAITSLLLACALQPAAAMGHRRTAPPETERGLASWYGADNPGSLTADGEIFNRWALTAAHRHLPFDSVIRVTNQMNGKFVEVRINDRGPWRDDRVLDVSEGAADLLDMKRAGTIPVLIEIVKLGPPGKIYRKHHPLATTEAPVTP